MPATTAAAPLRCAFPLGQPHRSSRHVRPGPPAKHQVRPLLGHRPHCLRHLQHARRPQLIQHREPCISLSDVMPYVITTLCGGLAGLLSIVSGARMCGRSQTRASAPCVIAILRCPSAAAGSFVSCCCMPAYEEGQNGQEAKVKTAYGISSVIGFFYVVAVENIDLSRLGQ